MKKIITSLVFLGMFSASMASAQTFNTQSQINSILAQLANLKLQLADLSGGLTPTTITPPTSGTGNINPTPTAVATPIPGYPLGLPGSCITDTDCVGWSSTWPQIGPPCRYELFPLVVSVCTGQLPNLNQAPVSSSTTANPISTPTLIPPQTQTPTTIIAPPTNNVPIPNNTSTTPTSSDIAKQVTQIQQQAANTVVTPYPSMVSTPLDRYLGVGDTGEDVKNIQTFLGVNSTGYYGPLTTTAVKTFQRINNLPQTGSIGPMTKDVINATGSTSPTVFQGVAQNQNNQSPVITGLGLASVPFANAGGNLIINGSGFTMESRVSVDGNIIAMVGNFQNYFITPNRITVNIPRANLTQKPLGTNITTTTTFDIRVVNEVVNQAPSGVSNVANFLVIFGSNNPEPIINAFDAMPAGLSSTRVYVGSRDFLLTVRGSNFVAGAVVRFGGITERFNRSTTVNSSGELTALIPKTAINSVGQKSVTVFNRGPGGGNSNIVNFTVNAHPVPTITSVDPTRATVGTQGVNVTITGTNFTLGSIVTTTVTAGPMPGNPTATRTITFNNSTSTSTGTQIIFTMPTTALTMARTFRVRVVNPATGGGGGPSVENVTFTVAAAR